MSAYIVAYDLRNEVRRPPIVEEVKATAWAKLSESCYAIDTNETASAVRKRFMKHLDSDDYLYVITISRPWSAFGLTTVIEWLTKRIGSGE